MVVDAEAVVFVGRYAAAAVEAFALNVIFVVVLTCTTIHDDDGDSRLAI